MTTYCPLELLFKSHIKVLKSLISLMLIIDCILQIIRIQKQPAEIVSNE